MGYTHYWSTQDCDDADSLGMEQALPFVRDIVERHAELLCYEHDQSDQFPEVTTESIRFNGKGEDGHETFVFGGDGDFQFCKTARKPYDLAVCETLLVLNALMPKMTLSSDGFCGQLADQTSAVTFDGTWDEAIENVRQYGFHYEGRVVKERPPYCDLEPVLVKNEHASGGADELAEEEGAIAPTASDGGQHVFCGICGHRATQLFTHLCNAHQLDTEGYGQRCKGAPLFSPAFGRWAKGQNLRIEDGRHRVDRDLFNLTVACDLLPKPGVPDVDEDYRFDETVGRPLVQSLLENDRVLLVGDTGCGKSSLVSQLAARMNRPVRRVNLHGETGVSDFVGQWTVVGKEMQYQYGILPTAMREGQILVLEELDAADPAILFILQGVLEEDGLLVLTDNGGEAVVPHPDFRLVATANTLGLGDESGLYTGTHVLNASHLDRWTAVFQMGYLPEAEEGELLLKKVPHLDAEQAGALVKLANAVRKAAVEEQVFCTFSTRRLLALARKLIAYRDTRQAFEITVLNKLAPGDRQVVSELAQRLLPEAVA